MDKIAGFDPSRVFHWGFVVPNMDRALASWLRAGARVLVPAAVDPLQNVSCALLIYRGAAPIELVAPLPDGPNPVETRLKKGGGLDHVCLFSSDLESDLQDLETEGGIVAVEPCYAAVFDRRIAFVRTRVGLVVELMTSDAVGRLPIDPLTVYFAESRRAAQSRASGDGQC